MTDLVRTKTSGCFQVRSNAWGSFLSRVPDPEATAELEPGALDKFELHPDIQKIPADLWARWIQLCFHFAHLRQGDLEVSCRLLRHEDDRSRWRILIPEQLVSGGSVRIDTFDCAIDIATGEVIESYPPAGWVPAGSSHSHNTMELARFSSTDDASELGCPGLHIVISHIKTLPAKTYRATASVTANRRRFYLPDVNAVVDTTPLAETFHPAVLEVVQPERWERRGDPLMGSWPPSTWLPSSSKVQWPNEGYPDPWREPAKRKPKAAATAAPTAKNGDPDPFAETIDEIRDVLHRGMQCCLATGDDPYDLLVNVIEMVENERLDIEALIDDETPATWDTPHDDSLPSLTADARDRATGDPAPVAGGLPDGLW